MMVMGTVSPPRALTTMQPFFRELSVNRETALALFDGLSEAQLGWRPAPTRWSLAEICGHLATTTALYLEEMDPVIAKAHIDAAYSDRAFEGSTLGRLLVWSFEPPIRLKLRTFRQLEPTPGEPPLRALTRYRSAQRELELRMEHAAGLDLAHVRVRLPELRWARLSLGTVIAMLLAHERRHLWQATVVRRDPAFPRS